MTSRRGSQTSFRLAPFALGVFACALLGACAALPDDAHVVEQLDTETGATVTRLGHPVEVYRETFLREASGRFAFVGPFETNQMGQRELYLWLAVPIEPVTDAVPEIEINGKALALGSPGRDGGFAGVHESPYKIPTPWSAMYYFKVDDAVMAQLGDANDISVSVLENGKSGPIKTRFSVKVIDTRLKDFSAR